MCNNLRKVSFCILKDGYLPNLSPKEEAERENLSRERRGYFHKWVEEVDTSKEKPFIKAMALVEDAEDGTVYAIEYFNLKFTEE